MPASRATVTRPMMGGALCAAVSACCALPAYASQAKLPADFERITQVHPPNFARNPHFARMPDSRLCLIWRNRNPHFVRVPEAQWPFIWRDGARDRDEDELRAKGTAFTYTFVAEDQLVKQHHMFRVMHAIWGASMAVDPEGQALVLAFERGRFWAFGGYDAVLWRVNARSDRGPLFVPDEYPLAGLPHCLAGIAAPAGTQEALRRHFAWPLSDRGEYRQPSLYIEPRSGRWYLAGVDSNRGAEQAAWLTVSDDGRTWQPRVTLGRGNFPRLLSAPNGDLLVLYVQAGWFGYGREWWDDVYHKLEPSCLRAMGALVLRRAPATIADWSPEEPVAAVQDVVQAGATIGPTGTIHVALVRANAEGNATSLWLVSSDDSGHTWSEPVRLTEPDAIYREPDLAVQDGSLLVAFSRTPKDGATDVWVARLPLEG